VTQRFGTKTQEHIVEMASHRLKRQILEEVSAS
jgi:hypothetical protein